MRSNKTAATRPLNRPPRPHSREHEGLMASLPFPPAPSHAPQPIITFPSASSRESEGGNENRSGQLARSASFTLWVICREFTIRQRQTRFRPLHPRSLVRRALSPPSPFQRPARGWGGSEVHPRAWCSSLRNRDFGDSGVLVVTEEEAGTCAPDCLLPAPASHGRRSPDLARPCPGSGRPSTHSPGAVASSALTSWSSGPGSGQQAWKGLSPQDMCLGPSCSPWACGFTGSRAGGCRACAGGRPSSGREQAGSSTCGQMPPSCSRGLPRRRRRRGPGQRGQGARSGQGSIQHQEGRRQSWPCLCWASAHWAELAQQRSRPGSSDFNSR